MEQISRVVVVGRGAVGALYCAAFSHAQGVDLRVAVDEERAQRYAEEVFVLNGQRLDLEYFTPCKSSCAADLVIIATKWEGYADALDLIEPIVGEHTIILPLLNGLLPYEIAEQRFGAGRAMRGYYIGHTASREGNLARQDGAYRTVVGEKNNESGNFSQRLVQLIALFDRAGVKYRVDTDMDSSRWLKFVINIGLNQSSAIDGGQYYGRVRAIRKYRDLCDSLIAEAVLVAEKLGIKNAESMSDQARDLLDTLPSEDYSSMAQDVRAGRVTEWPIFGGHLIEMAANLNIDLPIHREIELLIKQVK